MTFYGCPSYVAAPAKALAESATGGRFRPTIGMVFIVGDLVLELEQLGARAWAWRLEGGGRWIVAAALA